VQVVKQCEGGIVQRVMLLDDAGAEVVPDPPRCRRGRGLPFAHSTRTSAPLRA